MNLKHSFWERHSNPWSGWTRVLAYFAVIAALYRRSQWGLIGSVVFIIVNPVIFPQPRSIDNWMSKGVLGERLWTEGEKLEPLPRVFSAASVPFFLAAVGAAWMRMLRTTIVSTLLSSALKLLFVNEMVKLYERNQQKQGSGPSARQDG